MRRDDGAISLGNDLASTDGASCVKTVSENSHQSFISFVEKMEVLKDLIKSCKLTVLVTVGWGHLKSSQGTQHSNIVCHKRYS